MKEEEIIKRYISRSNQNWGGATPEWVEKEFRQALQSYKDWLWKEADRIIKGKKGDDDAYPVWNDTLDTILSEIQSLIKPEIK